MHTAEAQKMNPPPRCGREHFTGYIADLIDEVTNYMNFNYSLCVVGDDQYGSKLPNGTWNGLIGDLTRNVRNIIFETCKNVFNRK